MSRPQTRTRTQRMAWRGARLKILAAANEGRYKNGLGRLRMKHLQLAVCIVRRRRLVEDKVLVAAGFNPGPPPKVAADPADALSPPGRGRAARGEAA